MSETSTWKGRLRLGMLVGVQAVVSAEYTAEYPHASRELVRTERECEGVVVGVRTMAEGRREYWDDEGYTFYPSGYRQVVLVAVSMKELVRAFPEDVEPMAHGESIRRWVAGVRG